MRGEKESSCGFHFEEELKKRGINLIIGVDEAGRGPLAGPVVACAVTLLTACFKNRIDDSKKLTSIQRENSFQEIIKKSIFGIGIASEKIIDRINILEATRLAMEEAVRSLINRLKPQEKYRVHLLVDGNMGINVNYPVTSIIGGDAKSKSIAGASILAKVIRDRIMSLYDRLYPGYGFIQHKGYPTRVHRLALKKFGPTLIHRVTFNGV